MTCRGIERTCPTEEEEEITFSKWCDTQGYTHWHVPQETYTTSWKQKQKNKDMGVLSGVSDHWIVIPTRNKPAGSLIIIELKRLFGNTPTDDQIKFLETMQAVDNIAAVCCYGAEEAISVCQELKVGQFTTFDKCWERTEKLKEKRKNRPKNVKKPEKNKNALPY